jgi:glycosyltransferase involved in cell wall biosynthesis
MKHATTALAMIVRNEQANLPACLESVRGLFDELVIVDTGSTDDTIRIARSFGARIYRFEWCDDFAAARNFGLDRVRSDYVFRMDADDVLPAGHRKRLGRLLDSLAPGRPECFACRVYAYDHQGTLTSNDEHRLWPNDPEIRFVGRVHERISPELTLPTLPSGVRIDHSGYADEATVRAKLRRNLAILEREEAGPNPAALVYYDLGRTRSSLGELDQAVLDFEKFFQRGASVGTLSGRVARRRVVEIHRHNGDLAKATAALQAGLKLFPDDPVLLGYTADILQAVGQPELAREGFAHALRSYRPDRPDSALPVDFRQRIQTAMNALPEPATQSLAAILG